MQTRWNIYSKAGALKAVTDTLELHDEWMGECYVTLTIESPSPVGFAIDDYLDYRGERFIIDFDPSIIKDAERDSYGKAFVYNDIKFVHEAHSKILRCDFTDIVLSDNQSHYTSLPKFPFFCGSVDDLLDRIQANLEELFPGEFTIIGLNTVRNRSRATCVSPAAVSRQDAEYRKYVDPSGAEKTDDYGVLNVALTVDNITCWDALAKVNESFELNFILRGYTIIVGTYGSFTANKFKYGKGNGLYEIEQVAADGAQVVTRLKAYGNETNLPLHYYAHVKEMGYTTVRSYSASGNGYLVTLDLMYNPAYFNGIGHSDVGVGWRELGVRIGAVSGMARVYIIATGPRNTDFYLGTEENTSAVVSAFGAALAAGAEIYLTSGVATNRLPSANVVSTQSDTSIPSNMAISRLMLPGFPSQSLADWVAENRPELIAEGFTFSTNPLRPYIDSPNVALYGIRPGNIYFDGSNETENVYPTITEMVVDGVEVDVIAEAEQITDNGVFTTNTDVPNFKITLPKLGFALDAVIMSDAAIEMKDGMCGARSFKIVNVKPLENGQWQCEVERTEDSSLHLWFPYEDFQIRTGDHYVLTGIELPEEYVEQASVRLFDEAIPALRDIHAPKFTWQPKIDELFMARQNEAAEHSSGVVSLHDSLCSGDLFLFEDADLGIDLAMPIDILTIKENDKGNGIPTYEISLREEKAVTAIQRLTNKIDSIANGSIPIAGGNGSAGGSGDGISIAVAKQMFLSKQDADTAQGHITFEDGLTSNGDVDVNGNTETDTLQVNDDAGVGGDLNVSGNATIGGNAEISGNTTLDGSIGTRDFEPGVRGWQADKNGNIEVESLTSRSFIMTEAMLINRQQGQEGDTLFTENDQVEAVESFIDETDGSTHYILTLKEKWEGYFTAQQVGNIVKGIVNTFAAKDAGVSDYTSSADLAYQGQDNGGNYYYTSWMHVVATHNTAQGRLGVNQIEVVLFGDTEVLAGKNFPPCELMTIARRGCVLNPQDYPEGSAERASIERRQTLFEISVTDGRITKLSGVMTPKLANGNFGVTIGELPNFVKNYPDVASRYKEGDYMYAQGIVVGDYIKIDKEGKPVPHPIYPQRNWVSGQALIDAGETPEPGYGIYYANHWNADNRQYETHYVTHKGVLWQCLQTQPVVSGSTVTYYEPKWNSAYWRLVDGNENITIEFDSSRGYSFRRGAVNTTITPYLFYGNVDITDDVDEEYWLWTRESESGKTEQDATWDAQHTRQKVLQLSNTDMPQGWSSANKAIFTCTVTVNDGKTTRIVNNQIIS